MSGFSKAEIETEASCLFCGAQRGRPCMDTRTGRATQLPHPSRTRDAGLSLVGEQESGWEQAETPKSELAPEPVPQNPDIDWQAKHEALEGKLLNLVAALIVESRPYPELRDAILARMESLGLERSPEGGLES